MYDKDNMCMPCTLHSKDNSCEVHLYAHAFYQWT